jgi:hypothetical protein
LITDRCIQEAELVESERTAANGCVLITGAVRNERFSTDGRVGIAGGVAKESSITVGCVAAASGVARERLRTDRRINEAIVVEKRRNTDGSVAGAGVVK